MQKIEDPKVIQEQYAAYLSDESRMTGTGVQRLYFPESTEDVVRIVNEVRSHGERLAISGARTGIVGGAVPCDVENLISLEKLVGPVQLDFDGEWLARVPAGLSLETFTARLASGDYKVLHKTERPPRLWYPVNPTEKTALIGSTVATNASGSRSFHFGSTRQWVRRLTVVLADGRVLNLTRGSSCASGGIVTLAPDLSLPVPAISMPSVKATVGYYLAPQVDAVDLFIGSEGTLGIITEVDLMLARQPATIVCQLLYFKARSDLLNFVAAIRTHATAQPIALEYFDTQALALLREKRTAEGPSSALAPIPDTVQYALYVENACALDDELDTVCAVYEELLAEHGSSAEYTWAGFDAKTYEEMQLVRHAVPEAINTIIGQRQARTPSITKVSSDMAVPPEHLEHMLTRYEEAVVHAGFDYVIFGHIGDGNVHVNILPKSGVEVRRARDIYLAWAREVVACGGSVAAEHGIGRLKKALLAIQYPPAVIAAMRQVRLVLDPHCMLNPGVLFDV